MSYYVSIINDSQVCLALGPFATHQEALDRVNEVKKLAQELDPWAWFYAFGTCKTDTDKPGRLNHLLPQKGDV